MALQKRRRVVFWPICLAVLAAIVVLPPFVTMGLEYYRDCQVMKTYMDSSDAPWPELVVKESLPDTTVAVTSECPIEEGQNVVWCASFESAWQKLAEELGGSEIVISGAEKLSSRLNLAIANLPSLPEGSSYFAAGLVEDGIVREINNALERQFQGQETLLPDLSGASTEAMVAYAALSVHVTFTRKFFSCRTPIAFVGPGRSTQEVEGFGVTRDCPGDNPVREQVRVLFDSNAEDEESYDVVRQREFVLDPCHSSGPSQILLAVIEPEATLDATVEKALALAESDTLPSERRKLNPNGRMEVPIVRFAVQHRVTELVGIQHQVVSPESARGYWVADAVQYTGFRLDREGAVLQSFGLMHVESRARDYVFDRPFLILLRVRGSRQPYFAAWIGNSALLVSHSASKKTR